MHYHKDILTYRWISIALCALILVVAGAGSLGIVYLRTQISHTASNVAKLEREARILANDNDTLSARIARAHSPEFLVRHMPDGLRPTNGQQIMWIKTNASPAYIEQSLPVTVADSAPATHQEPAAVSFDLALINAPRGPNP